MRTFFITAGVCLLASASQAQGPSRPSGQAEAPDAQELELAPIEVSVEAESEAERKHKSAESVRVVDTKDIQYEGASLGEALARTENVTVRAEGGLGSRSRFSLGGLSDEQVRFFIDGIPLELAGFGAGLGNVPVNLVQRVELYSGVVPIRFGADALGGAVNLVTDQDWLGTRTSASYELGSFDTHRVTVGFRHLDEPSGLFVRAHGYVDRAKNDYPIEVEVPNEQGQLQPARVYRFHDAYTAGGLGVEGGLVDQPWARRLLLHAFLGAYDKQLQNNPSMTTPYGDVDSGALTTGATLRFEQLFPHGWSTDSVAGYTFRRTRFTDVGTCAYDWFGRCFQQLPQPGEVQSRAVERHVEQHTGFARLDAAWRANSQQVLRFSLAPTGVTRSGEDSRLRERGQPDPLAGRRDVFSLITGVEHQLDALSDRLENVLFLKDYLQLARTQKLLPTGDFAELDRNTHRVGVGDSARLRLLDGLYAKASYEWATRLPGPDEIFGDGIIITENLELKPEVSHNLNLSLTATSPRTPGGTFRGEVTGFGRFAQQLIVLLGQESFFIYQNVYAARILGGTGLVGWTSPGGWFNLEGNVTGQDVRNVSQEGAFGAFEGQRIPNRPYLTANGTARFQLDGLMMPRDSLSLVWHTRYVHSFFRSWEGLGRQDSKLVIPSQLLHSVVLTYVVRRDSTTLSWTLDVQNLTDSPAYDFYGVQRPGRSFFAKLTVEH